jgi:hypothetical protein
VQDGKTPRQIAHTKEMRRAIDRARLYGETTAPPRIRLFLCGHGEVGKSTLARALQRSDIAASLLSLPSVHNERTHGFAAFPATIPGAGECTIVDFAGQSEYWVPNGMLMATESGVFLVVCNLADPPDMQFSQLRYWLRFIASRASRASLQAKPRVALVGTHRSAAPTLKKKLSSQTAADQEKTKQQIKRLDRIKRDGDRWVSTLVGSFVPLLLEKFADLLEMSPQLYYVDSVSPHKIDLTEMRRLREWLGLMFDDVRALKPVPKVCLEVAALLSKVRKTSVTDVLAPFDRVLTELRVCAPDTVDLSDDDRVRAVLSHLSDTGDIMYFEDAGDVVVLQPHEFGERVIGQLFCPVGTPGFTSLLAIDKDLGYRFRRSALVDALNKLEKAAKSCNVGDIDTVLRILQDLELVFPVHNSKGADALADTLYAVPGRLAHTDNVALVNRFETMCVNAWKDATAGCHHVGVRLRINNSSLMIPPSTSSRLLYRLSAAPGFAMWQRGARTTCVPTGDGRVFVEGLIDIDDSLQFIDVVVRSEVEGLAALQSCVEHLQHVVATCEAVCAESVVRFEARVILLTPFKARNGAREVAGGDAPPLPADAKEAGLSQPQFVVAGLLPMESGVVSAVDLETDAQTQRVAPEEINWMKGSRLTFNVLSDGLRDLFAFEFERQVGVGPWRDEADYGRFVVHGGGPPGTFTDDVVEVGAGTAAPKGHPPGVILVTVDLTARLGKGDLVCVISVDGIKGYFRLEKEPTVPLQRPDGVVVPGKLVVKLPAATCVVPGADMPCGIRASTRIGRGVPGMLGLGGGAVAKSASASLPRIASGDRKQWDPTALRIMLIGSRIAGLDGPLLPFRPGLKPDADPAVVEQGWAAGTHTAADVVSSLVQCFRNDLFGHPSRCELADALFSDLVRMMRFFAEHCAIDTRAFLAAIDGVVNAPGDAWTRAVLNQTESTERARRAEAEALKAIDGRLLGVDQRVSLLQSSVDAHAADMHELKDGMRQLLLERNAQGGSAS